LRTARAGPGSRGPRVSRVTRSRHGGRHRDRSGPTPQATAALALAAAALVLLTSAAHVQQRTGGLLAELAGSGAVVTLSGTVTGDPAPLEPTPERPGPERLRLPLRVETVEGRGLGARARAPVLLLAPTSWQ